ncbi:hypothetical protein MUP59_09220 [Candidatus Bathyarchaeota archaeon]|nr:hypothetical protein [Candidatus Bathyarchaeota archaeon]
MHQLERITPYMIAAVGVAMDFATTQVGLARGFLEAHLLYSPVYSLVIFWTLLTVATLALPTGKARRMFIFAIAWLTFVGVFNNVFVITGIFRGL